jgi:hypothetical protein
MATGNGVANPVLKFPGKDIDYLSAFVFDVVSTRFLALQFSQGKEIGLETCVNLLLVAINNNILHDNNFSTLLYYDIYFLF